jgi:DNA-binding IclR family transcriptional regulator
MRKVRDELNETVILAVRARFRRVNIDYVESTQAIRRGAMSGFEAPLHIGAAGRCLMSGLTGKELDDYFGTIPMVTFNSKAQISRSDIMTQLEQVREQGYAVSTGEITAEAAVVSAPIYDHRGDVVATFTISCPIDRFTTTLEEACIKYATKAANDLSFAMGGVPRKSK